VAAQYLAEGAPPQTGRAVPDAFVDAEWRLLSLPEHSVVEPAWLRFQKDGSVVGRTGCNNLRTIVTIEAQRIVFGPVATTRMACPGDALAAQEMALLSQLETATTYEIDARRLVLRSAEQGEGTIFERQGGD
jgi:putative lipoprotein